TQRKGPCMIGRSAFLIVFLAATSAAAAVLGDWPEFRGPTGQGIAEGASPPVEWGLDHNIVWKRALPGLGWSSPVLYDGAIYLTTALVDAEENLTSLRALRVD